jgi:hypothetical protein
MNEWYRSSKLCFPDSAIALSPASNPMIAIVITMGARKNTIVVVRLMVYKIERND